MIGLLTGILLILGVPAAAHAQAGVPGGRLESGRDYRASLRAEMYSSVATFFSRWREAWNEQDVKALARMYTDDATVRLPGLGMVRGKEPLETLLSGLDGPPISMSDVDFDSDGMSSILVARYLLRQEGRSIQGVMTAVMFRAGRSWRLRVQIFDAPEVATSASPDDADIQREGAIEPISATQSQPHRARPLQATEPAPLEHSRGQGCAYGSGQVIAALAPVEARPHESPTALPQRTHIDIQ